jgi:hypothetical protein
MYFTIEHTIPLSRDDYWKILHDPEFEAFQAKELKLKTYKEISRVEKGDVVLRRVRVQPEVHLPSTVEKIVAKYIPISDLGYEEEQEKHVHDFYLKFRIHPPILPDKIKIAGVFSLKELDAQSCLRLLEGEIEIQLFGVGGIVERFIVEELKKTYDKIPSVVAHWKERRVQVSP